MLPIEFYIVGESGYVLSIDEHNSVILSTRIGIKKQLWTWDGYQLVSSADNLALTVDYKDEVIVSEEIKDGKQEWRFEGNCLFHHWSNKILTLEKGTNKYCRIIVTEKSSNSDQFWVIEPRLATADMDKILLDRPYDNPVENLLHLRMRLQNDLAAICDLNITQYKSRINEAMSHLEKCAAHLDEVKTDTSIARATGAGIGILGGAAGLIGLGLAPFTAGLSLTLTLGGALTTVAGSATSLTSTLINKGWENSEMKKAKEITNDVARITQSLQELLGMYMLKLIEAKQFLEKNPQFARSSSDEIIEDGKIIQKITGTGYQGYTAGSKIYRGYKGVQALKQMMAMLPLEVDELMFARSALAGSVAAPKVAIPCVGELLQAGTVGAKVFSGAFGVVGIGFGIWETIDATTDIQNGSEIAKEMRKIATNLDQKSKEIMIKYEQLILSE